MIDTLSLYILIEARINVEFLGGGLGLICFGFFQFSGSGQREKIEMTNIMRMNCQFYAMRLRSNMQLHVP